MATPEQKVRRYIRENEPDLRRLKFSLDSFSNMKAPKNVTSSLTAPKSKSVSAIVKFVMRETLFRHSMIDNDIHTHVGARRSAVDIWRHVIRYNDKIDIFQVMRFLYRTNKIYTRSVCSMIEKRVFRPEFIEPSSYDDDERDEFDLTFSQWKRIGL